MYPARRICQIFRCATAIPGLICHGDRRAAMRDLYVPTMLKKRNLREVSVNLEQACISRMDRLGSSPRFAFC